MLCEGVSQHAVQLKHIPVTTVTITICCIPPGHPHPVSPLKPSSQFYPHMLLLTLVTTQYAAVQRDLQYSLTATR